MRLPSQALPLLSTAFVCACPPKHCLHYLLPATGELALPSVALQLLPAMGALALPSIASTFTSYGCACPPKQCLLCQLVMGALALIFSFSLFAWSSLLPYISLLSLGSFLLPSSLLILSLHSSLFHSPSFPCVSFCSLLSSLSFLFVGFSVFWALSCPLLPYRGSEPSLWLPRFASRGLSLFCGSRAQHSPPV